MFQEEIRENTLHGHPIYVGATTQSADPGKRYRTHGNEGNKVYAPSNDVQADENALLEIVKARKASGSNNVNKLHNSGLRGTPMRFLMWTNYGVCTIKTLIISDYFGLFRKIKYI